MKLSVSSFAKKLSIPSPKGFGNKNKAKSSSNKSGPSLSRSEASSFASSSSSSDESMAERSAQYTPKSVLSAVEISRQELEAVLRRLGHEEPSDDELDAVAAIAAEAASGAEDELREAFAVFDADGDGRITPEELRGVLVAILGGDEGCTIDDCRRMIGGVDADGDGFVGFEDFARMMMMDGRRFL